MVLCASAGCGVSARSDWLSRAAMRSERAWPISRIRLSRRAMSGVVKGLGRGVGLAEEGAAGGGVVWVGGDTVLLSSSSKCFSRLAVRSAWAVNSCLSWAFSSRSAMIVAWLSRSGCVRRGKGGKSVGGVWCWLATWLHGFASGGGGGGEAAATVFEGVDRGWVIRVLDGSLASRSRTRKEGGGGLSFFRHSLLAVACSRPHNLHFGTHW